MNDVKLTDFTYEELRVAYVAIGIYQHDHKDDPKINDMCERLMTQLAYAGGLNSFKDKVASN